MIKQPVSQNRLKSAFYDLIQHSTAIYQHVDGTAFQIWTQKFISSTTACQSHLANLVSTSIASREFVVAGVTSRRGRNRSCSPGSGRDITSAWNEVNFWWSEWLRKRWTLNERWRGDDDGDKNIGDLYFDNLDDKDTNKSMSNCRAMTHHWHHHHL